jgi:hypothetical protein
MQKGKILLPPDITKIDGPLIFLAGPIHDARDWQKEAIAIFQADFPEVNIASPRRETFDESFVYEDQIDWETRHLRRAGENGVVMFWLSEESDHLYGKAFAQTTRFELAEWKLRHERDGIKLAIGMEEGFTGERYFRWRFSHDCPDVPILKTLTETCRVAGEMALQGNSLK